MPCAGKNRVAFTLLEALVALMLVALIAAVLVTAHVRALRTEESAQWLSRSRLQAERIFTETRLGLAPESNAVAQAEGWKITSASIPLGDEQNQDIWSRWTIAPSNRPSLQTVIFLRQP